MSADPTAGRRVTVTFAPPPCAVTPGQRIEAGQPMEAGQSVEAVQRLTITGAQITVHGAFPARSIELGHVVWLTAAEQSVIELDAIRTDVGIGAVLASVLLPLGDAPVYSTTEQDRVAAIVRGLISAAAAERIEDGLFAVPSRQMVVVRAMQIVQSRRDDPRLSSQSIARQLGISVRTLQAAFRDSSTTVVRSVRAIRSEHEALSRVPTGSLSWADDQLRRVG